MSRLVLLGLLLAGASNVALAEPDRSQHPRVGQLAELAFAPGSAELAVEADARVADKLGLSIAWAEDHPDGLLVLDGHADRRGGRASNVRLSMQRAKVVRERLVAAGANPDQIVIAAFGEDGPRSDRSVIIWGTRAGLDAVVARTARTTRAGRTVIATGVVGQADRPPQPGAVRAELSR